MQWRHRAGVGVLVLVLMLVVAASAASFLARRFLHSFPANMLDVAGRAAQYADAPFSTEEAAGIGFLTSLGAVEGYGDGTFRPGDTLNRAEFLKIVLKSSHRSAEVSPRPARCFPDVQREDWFSPLVCFVKERNIIAGYPDGLFRPGNPVNYAEAIKMLVELYGYPRTAATGDLWFSPHVRSATGHGVFLLADLPLDAPLTRGHMARLAAAFRAEHEGELAEYLERERGQGSGDVQEEYASSSVHEESSSAASSVAMLGPVKSHHLLLGEISLPIAQGTFLNPQDEAVIRRIHLRLESTVKSLKAVHVLNAAGGALGSLRVDTNDTEERRNWLLEFDLSNAPHVSGGGETVLFFSAELEKRGMGGIPGELLRVQRISLILQNPTAGVSWETMPAEQTFPVHQTVQARLDQIEQRGESGPLTEGIDRLLGTFAFAGTIPPETDLRLVELLIRMRADGVDVTKWRLRHGSIAMECFRTYGEDTLLTCPGIPAEIGRLIDGHLVLELRGDVKRTGEVTAPFLELSLASAGNPGENGALRWMDGSKEYNWVDLPGPLTENARWTLGP